MAWFRDVDVKFGLRSSRSRHIAETYIEMHDLKSGLDVSIERALGHSFSCLVGEELFEKERCVSPRRRNHGLAKSSDGLGQAAVTVFQGIPDSNKQNSLDALLFF